MESAKCAYDTRTGTCTRTDASAPDLVAQQRIEEARGRLAGASVRQQENPVIGSSIGPRFSPSGDTVDTDVSLSQSFELGGRRASRIAGARAGIERETATRQDVLRQLLRDVSVAFSKALAAKERLSLASGSSKIAGELLQSMERRFQAGDVPILDVNLARNSAARARADVRAAQAAYTSAIGDLRFYWECRTMSRSKVIGDLHDRRRFDLSALMEKAGDRPDLRALRPKETKHSPMFDLAWIPFADALRPVFTYKRDQGDNVVQGGLSFTLPVFNRGQELQAVGQARRRRIDQEIAATKRAVPVEVRTAYDVYNLKSLPLRNWSVTRCPALKKTKLWPGGASKKERSDWRNCCLSGVTRWNCAPSIQSVCGCRDRRN